MGNEESVCSGVLQSCGYKNDVVGFTNEIHCDKRDLFRSNTRKYYEKKFADDSELLREKRSHGNYKAFSSKIEKTMSYIQNFGERFGYGVPTTCCYVPVQSDRAKTQDTHIVQFWMYWSPRILRLINKMDCHHFQGYAFAHATTACALVKPHRDISADGSSTEESFMVSYQCDGENYMFAK